MKTRSFSALIASGILLAAATLALSGCGVVVLYKTPEYTYSGRPVPPSKLLQRVLAALFRRLEIGWPEILDGLRDLRGNVQNTTKSFGISGYSRSSTDQHHQLSRTDHRLRALLQRRQPGRHQLQQGKRERHGRQLRAPTCLGAASPLGLAFAGAAQQAGQLVFTTGGITYYLNLPGVNKVVIDPGFSVVLAMVQNSNTLYRIVKLPATANPVLSSRATWTVSRCFCRRTASFPWRARMIARST